jgi:hypothetical protein
MKSIGLCILSIVTFLLIFDSKSAYCGRPFSTEDATVADKGKIEAEIGFEYVRQNNRDNNYNIMLVPVYGLTENIEVSCELPFDILRPKEGTDEEGLGDINLVVKTLFFPEKEATPSLLLKTVVKLETGDEDDGLGSGDEDVGLILAATKSVGSITIHGNVGYTFVGTDYDDTLNDYLLYGIALEYPITQALALAGEVYIESDTDFEKESHSINPLIGLTYQLTDNATLDAAFRTGIRYHQKTEYGIITGISISF